MSTKFEFIRSPNTPISEEEILVDLKRLAKERNKETISQKEYREHGSYDDRTVSRK
jgi:hypothetical protein